MSKSMRWSGQPNCDVEVEFGPCHAPNEMCARHLVAWVNDNGGEARYLALSAGTGQGSADQPRIAVRTRDGWAYCSPGQRVVMGEAIFRVVLPVSFGCAAKDIREFTVEDA